MASKYRLTTNDNPYDPFNQFKEWYMFDMEKGYNTCGYLARTASITPDMSQKEEDDEVDRAINTILKNDVACIYKRVTRSTTSKADRGQG